MNNIKKSEDLTENKIKALKNIEEALKKANSEKDKYLKKQLEDRDKKIYILEMDVENYNDLIKIIKKEINSKG